MAPRESDWGRLIIDISLVRHYSTLCNEVMPNEASIGGLRAGFESTAQVQAGGSGVWKEVINMTREICSIMVIVCGLLTSMTHICQPTVKTTRSTAASILP